MRSLTAKRMRVLSPQSQRLPGCSAFGENEERALNEVKIAMQLWLETAKEIGRDIPLPQKRSLVAGTA